LKELPLPSPPQITPRRDLGAGLRRRVRHDSVPYSRPSTCKESPVRNRSVGFDLLRSMSPLSDPESSSSDEGKSDAPNRIPKPAGEAGRSNSGGYNLKNVLGWEEKRYSEFTVSYIVSNQQDKSYLRNRPLSMEQSQRNWIGSGVTVNRSRLILRSWFNW
jgi:hypothetical protein